MPIDPYSITAVPIFMNFESSRLAHGTAFFYKRRDEIYLVTNWHNLSGRNPLTGQSIKDVVPDNISVYLHARNRPGEWGTETFPLYDNSTSRWLQHSLQGQNVDVAILKISVSESSIVYPVNEVASFDGMRVEVGMDIFVLGFPIRLFTGIFPVWKRATVSTETDINVDGLPKFLIDTATREGMSGSPVVVRQRGSYIDASGNMIMGMASATKFLGVYSGRYGSDNLEGAQLGIVWKKELIDQIIDEGVPGQYQIR